MATADDLDPTAAARATHLRDGLRRADLVDDPIEQLQRWFDDATSAEVPEPATMALATADAAGRPSVRLVLLRGLDERGLVFYTNRESRKGVELAANPHAAVVLTWHSIGRQARASGPVEQVDEVESSAYFATRPRGSQISAWASPQSEVVAGRAELDRLREATEARFGTGPVERPPTWGGYRIRPVEIEVWQQQNDRFHDRFRYRRGDPSAATWVIERLGP